MEEMEEIKEQAMEMATRVRDCEGGRLSYWCPACDTAHVVNVGKDGVPGWAFNGDYLKPTLNPSILVQGSVWRGRDIDNPLDPKCWQELYCHSFVKDGMIEFCADSRHALAGKTVPIPAFR